ncbi:MAG: orotate phosphoribosyltransferase [Lachnospirales bacterium]
MSREKIETILEKSEVLLNGHFILTSGKHSKQYMQCAKICQYPEYNSELASFLVKEFENQEIDIVIAPAVGGIVFGYEVARQLKVKNLFAERENGKMTLRRGFAIGKGQKVLVVEDVVTTGGSVKEVMEVVREQGGEVIGVGVLVDRSNGTADFGVNFKSVYQAKVEAFEPEECPMCKSGESEAVKPGSRGLK